MADRLTQLQDAVNVQAENLCNSIGLLQQCSRPTPFPDFDTFTRSSSLAYKQVLIDAGIPVDLDDIDLLKQQNDDFKNGHENNVNNENNNANIVNNTNVSKKSIDNNKMNSDNVKQQQNSDTNINGDDQQHQQQLQQQTFFEPGENSRLFAKLITKTAKDIDLIINSLPSREMESELQEAHIKVLELENSEETKKLENVIDKAEKLLDIIKNALEDIAQNQMRMKQLESQMLTSSSSSPTTITTPQQKSSSLSLTSNDIEDKKTLSTKILHNLLESDDHDDFNNDLPD